MKKTLMAGFMALVLGPTLTGARELHGVRWDAVDWDGLCASMQPLEYSTEQGHLCHKVHPTASQWEKWHDMTGRNKPEPDWDCDQLAQHFDNYARGPGICAAAFRSSLMRRALYPARYNEPLEDWRASYFGPWLIGRK